MRSAIYLAARTNCPRMPKPDVQHASQKCMLKGTPGRTWFSRQAANKFVDSEDEVNCLVQNPDILQAGLVGAHGGTAGLGRAGWYANRIIHLLDNLFFSQPKRRKNVAKSACDQILSNPKPVNTTGKSGRRAWQGSGKRSDKIGCQRNDLHRNRRSTVFFSGIEEYSIQRLSRIKRYRIETNGGTKSAVDPWLTTGLSAVYHRFIGGTRRALGFWLPTSGTTPFCCCFPFPCEACPGALYFSECFKNLAEPVESKTQTYHGRVGSGRLGERLGWVGQGWVPIGLFDHET